MTISGGGGSSPRWSRNGRELFYVSLDNRLMVVPVRTTPSLSVGTPMTLFTIDEHKSWYDFDVSVDGRRFLAIVAQSFAGEQPLRVIVNWLATVKQ